MAARLNVLMLREMYKLPTMIDHKNNKFGFTIIETTVVVIVLAVVGFGGWWVWHNHRQRPADKNSSQTANKTTKAPSSPAHPTGLNDGDYLYIQQFGFKLPLADGMRDLGYIYQASGGENGAPLVILGSKDLAQDYENEDPTDCTAAFYDKSEGLQPISYIYDRPLSTGAPADETVTIGGKDFYWYVLNAGSGCDFSPSLGLSAAVRAYYQDVFNNFAHSQAIE